MAERLNTLKRIANGPIARSSIVSLAIRGGSIDIANLVRLAAAPLIRDIRHSPHGRAVLDTLRVSVLMVAAIGGRYLTETIESILTQSLDDFEFVIVNDASTNERNLRLPSSLNRLVPYLHGMAQAGR